MYHELLRDATFWAFLFSIDQDLAEALPQRRLLLRWAFASCQLPTEAAWWAS